MKKLIILISLIALLASGMAFAQVTIRGQIEYEVAESFDKDIKPKALTLKDPNTQAILNIKADDFTSGLIRLRQRKEDGPGKWVDYDRAYFTTNFLPAFGVKDAPVDLMGTFGLNEYTPAFVANVEWDIVKKFATKTKLDNNNKTKIDSKSYGNKKIEKWGMMPKISIMKMVDVAAAFSLESETLKDFFTDLVVGAPVGPGTLKGEFAYGISDTKEFDKGWMQFALAYAMKMGDIGLNFGAGYNMELDDKVISGAGAISGYGVGVKAAYGTLAYGFLGLQGYMKNSDANYDGELLHHVRIGVGARPVNAFGLDAGVILYTGGEKSVGEDSRTFNTLDVSGVVYVGKANFRLGYLYTPKNDPSIDPWKTDADKRSLYFIATLAY
jgi:hypothetical protein